MISKTDELNVIEKVKKRKIETIEEYFDVMDLSEEQRTDRVALASELENVLLFVFALCLIGNDKDGIVDNFYNRYIALIDYPYTDTQNVIRQNCEDIVESTLKNMGDAKEISNDNWWVSPDRALYLAENESNTTFNSIEYGNAVQNGFKYKVWRTEMDKSVRETHKPLNGAKKGIDELYLVGNSLMKYPKDTSYDADASEIANCRCTISYSN